MHNMSGAGDRPKCDVTTVCRANCLADRPSKIGPSCYLNSVSSQVLTSSKHKRDVHIEDRCNWQCHGHRELDVFFGLALSRYRASASWRERASERSIFTKCCVGEANKLQKGTDEHACKSYRKWCKVSAGASKRQREHAIKSAVTLLARVKVVQG
eukprot:6107679-Pleurochrysis_carterae.AAC.2